MTADDYPTVMKLRAWPDAVLDTHGYDPRGPYGEDCWLPILGPSTLLLMRRLVTCVKNVDDRTVLVERGLLGRMLGLHPQGGKRSTLNRSLERLVWSKLAGWDPDETFRVRLHLPPLTERHLERMPAPVIAAHRRYENMRHSIGAELEAAV